MQRSIPVPSLARLALAPMACLCFAVPDQILAQTYTIVPQVTGTDYTKVHGPQSMTSGLSDLYSRNMEVIHKNAMGFIGGKIKEIAFRPWPNASAFYHSRQITIRMGTTQHPPSNLPFHFDRVPDKQLVKVFEGKVNLPNYYTTPGKITPWLAVFKLQTPFLWAAPQGHFVVDIESRTTATTNFIWERDARFVPYDSIPGKERSLGLGCADSNKGVMQTWPYNASLAVPGKTMPIFMMKALSTNTFAFNFLGFSNTSPFPLSLSPLGMPGCKLYTGLDMLQMVKLGEANATGMRGIAYWPLPNNNTLTGAKINTQWFQIDGNANQLGLTMSEGVEITLGTPGKRQFMVQSLWSYAVDHREQGNQSSYEYGALMRIMR